MGWEAKGMRKPKKSRQAAAPIHAPAKTPDDDPVFRWYHWLVMGASIPILFFTHMPWRHWLACSEFGAGLAWVLMGGHPRVRRTVAWLGLAGGGVLALMYAMLPDRGAFFSYNQLNNLDDEGWVADIALVAGASFACGVLLWAWSAGRWLAGKRDTR
jgi:hypothetical protein